MLPCPCADKAAGLFPETIDLLLGDQPIDQAKGVGGVRQQPLGSLRLDLGGPAGEALADIDAPLTAPPLRVLAPNPRSLASSTTAPMPCLANSSAVDSPAYPPPTIATRADRGRSASSPAAGM